VDELLTYMRERDQQLEELQRQLREALAQNGYLRGQLDQRALPADRDALQKRVAKLERQLELAQEPWWKKRLRRTLTS
jgi:polyhydroxyalkanoate synthesis regulator phasin